MGGSIGALIQASNTVPHPRGTNLAISKQDYSLLLESCLNRKRGLSFLGKIMLGAFDLDRVTVVILFSFGRFAKFPF